MKKLLLSCLLCLCLSAGYAQTRLTLPDQSYYIIEEVSFPDPPNLVVISKYLSNGSLDLSFGTQGYSAPIAIKLFKAALQADGKILLSGTTLDELYDVHTDLMVTRINTDGTVDQTFNNTGVIFESMTMQSYDNIASFDLVNNRIVLIGYGQTLVGDFAAYQIYIYDLAGTRVNFFPGPTVSPISDFNPYSFQYSVGFQGSKIVIASTSYIDLNDGNGPQLVTTTSRYESNGSPDLSFGTNGQIPVALDLLGIQDDGFLLAKNILDPVTGKYGLVMEHYNYDGSVDTPFNNNSLQTVQYLSDFPLPITSIITQGNKIIVKSDSLQLQFNPDGTFDKVLGEEPEVILVCSKGKTVYTDPGVCTALLKEIGPFIAPSPDDAKVNYTLSGATTASGVGSVSGLIFNKGVTTVTYAVTGHPAQTCTFNVTVKDRVAPVLTNVLASPTCLWPPNHQLRDVAINYTLTDNCPGTVVTLSVKSNEPQTGTGRSDLPNDWQIIDPNHIKLRAERNELGTGRIYTVSITARDASGNVSRQYVTVTVPPNQGLPKQLDNGNRRETLQVKVLSNPTANYFTLQTTSNNNRPVVLRVTNAVGSVVETQTGVPANGQVQVGNNYREGFYFAELIQGGQKVVVKLVKLR